MLYVACSASRSVATLRLGVGSVLPMGSTAIGQAYLSALSAEQRDGLLIRLRQRAGAHADALDVGIRAGLLQLESGGTCAVLGGYQRNAFGVALPIRVGRNRALAAMSCGKAGLCPDLAKEHKRIAPALKAAAVELETLLADFEGRP
jgi:DNA-binding IclR family transcriptional regulator